MQAARLCAPLLKVLEQTAGQRMVKQERYVVGSLKKFKI
jgi:hypothetical protein